MADDPKQPHAGPPLADKGTARPLTRSGPGESQAADQIYARRPTGLHTRPDLYGARAVMPRPVETSSEASDPSDPRRGGEDATGGASADPRRDAAGLAAQHGDETAPPAGRDPSAGVDGDQGSDRPSDAPKVAGEAPASLPAATLLDQPLRIPETISFEDWPGGTESEPEHGARSPDGASAATSEPEPDAPVAPDQPAGHPENHGPIAGAPGEEAGRTGRLLDWMGGERNLGRLHRDRWPLAVAAASCAALLLAAVVGGVIPLGGEDQGPTELAQGPDAAMPDVPMPDEAPPAPEDLAGLPEADRLDIPVVPAGNNYGNDRPAGPLANQPAAEDGDQPDTSQLAALPDSRAPGPLDRGREPIVDFMRIDPDGKAVVAGRAAPGTELIVLDNGQPLGSITADIYGLWTFVSKFPLASGRHEIGLKVRRQGSEVSDPVLVTDSGSDLPQEPGAAVGQQDPAPSTTSRQNPAGTEQLAAAEPAVPVQSDQTAPEAPAEGLAAAEHDPAAAPSPLEATKVAEAAAGSGDPAEPAASEADRPNAEAASQSRSAAAPTTAQAAAPKPEPKPQSPGQVQTAAKDPASGRYVVQLASFKNRETAAGELAVVEKRFADLLAGHEVFIQQVDLADQGTFYRVRLGPFASLADARAACARFQERDRDCLAMTR
jgi:cell division septation protein DedD